jgi:hypothetical protein
MTAAAVPRGVREAYQESGYESPDAHSAEVEAMLVTTVSTEVDADERRRLVTEHLRLKAVNASRDFSVKRQTPPRPTSPASLPLWKSTDTRH